MGSQRVVVIGTGAGGLTASAFLAKHGFEVIALERAPQQIVDINALSGSRPRRHDISYRETRLSA